MSHLPGLVSHPVAPMVVALAGHPRHGVPSTHNPLNEKIYGGHVAKHPRFYSEYHGPRLAALNGIYASGALDLGVGYRFTGRVLGPIDPSQQAFYVFGVDRGGAKAPSEVMPPSAGGASGAKAGSGTTSGMAMGDGKSLVMFIRRPNIFVDALVTVSVGPSGTAGQVQLMQKDGSPGPTRPIAPQDIQVSGNQVTVLVDPGLLPPNGFPADRYYFAFWAGTGLATDNNVASFVPEYNVTQIGLRRG